MAIVRYATKLVSYPLTLTKNVQNCNVLVSEIIKNNKKTDAREGNKDLNANN